MSERLAGIDEANLRGFMQGLVTAKQLVSHEGRYQSAAVTEFTQRVIGLLDNMIDKSKPRESML